MKNLYLVNPDFAHLVSQKTKNDPNNLVIPCDRYAMNAYQTLKFVAEYLGIKPKQVDKFNTINLVGVNVTRREFTYMSKKTCTPVYYDYVDSEGKIKSELQYVKNIKTAYDENYKPEDFAYQQERTYAKSPFAEKLDIIDKAILVHEFHKLADKVFVLIKGKKVEVKLNLKDGDTYTVSNYHSLKSLEQGYTYLRNELKSMTPYYTEYRVYGKEEKEFNVYNKLRRVYYNIVTINLVIKNGFFYKFSNWTYTDPFINIRSYTDTKGYYVNRKQFISVNTIAGQGMVLNKLEMFKLTNKNKSIIQPDNFHKCEWVSRRDDMRPNEITPAWVGNSLYITSEEVNRSTEVLYGLEQNTLKSDEVVDMIRAEANMPNCKYMIEYIQNYTFDFNQASKVCHAYQVVRQYAKDTFDIELNVPYLVFNKEADYDACYEDTTVDHDYAREVADYDPYIDVDITASVKDLTLLQNADDVDYAVGTIRIRFDDIKEEPEKASSESFKVVIAGTRTFNNYTLLSAELDHLLQNKSNIEIVSGGCKGADKLGEQYAINHKYSLKVFEADWQQYGNAAGPKRNKQMADYADALVAFWDGESKGTKNMIELAKAAGLAVRVFNKKKEGK